MLGYFLIWNGESFEHNNISRCNIETGVLTREYYAQTDVHTPKHLDLVSKNHGLEIDLTTLMCKFPPKVIAHDGDASPTTQMQQMYQFFFLTEIGCFEVNQVDRKRFLRDIGALKDAQRTMQAQYNDQLDVLKSKKGNNDKDCCAALRRCCLWAFSCCLKREASAQYKGLSQDDDELVSNVQNPSQLGPARKRSLSLTS